MTLKTDSGRAVWTAHIEFSSQRGGVLITHTIDALDGHTLSTSCDERFSDRPRTRSVESITIPTLRGSG